ncbi:hypothetical protein D3C85_1307170 [compost metagenome]
MCITRSYSKYFWVSCWIPWLFRIVVAACRDQRDVFVIGVLNSVVEKARIGVIAKAEVHDFCPVVCRPDDPLCNGIRTARSRLV